MQAAQAFVVAIAFGVLLIAWAISYFNEPQTPDEIRFSVPQQRYFVALGAHVSAILAIYVLLVITIYALIALPMALQKGELPPSECYRTDFAAICAPLFKTPPAPKPDVIVWSALLAVLFVRLVMPNTPIIRRLAERLRNLTHDLALFPFARQSLISMLSTSPFTPRTDSGGDLAEELARYGVTAKWASCLSRSATHSLLEVHSLRRQLIELSHSSQALGTAFWQPTFDIKTTSLAAESESAKTSMLASSRVLQRFGRARATALAETETSFRRLVRRTALALLLVEELSAKVEDGALCRSVSNFVAEECDNVLVRYRQLIAEAALSCVPHRAERALFLKYFGYDVKALPQLPSLSLRPWLIVFVVDLALFLVPSVMAMLPGAYENFERLPLLLFPFVHAIGQSVAITWAIYPKVASNVTANFARPSFYFGRPPLYSLPWQSYIVFGLASYASGAAILLMFRLLVPMPFPVVLPTLLSSSSFMFMTVVTSFLIDLRLQSGSLDFEKGRFGDGLFMGLVMFASTLLFQFLMFYVAPVLHLADVTPPPFIPLRATFLLLSAILGFVMGYFVPAAGTAFLQKATLLQMAGRLDRKLASLGQPETRWAPQLSPQA